MFLRVFIQFFINLSKSLQFHYCFSLYYLFTSLLWKKLTSTMASTAAFSLKQVYTINLLYLMSPDTVMQASRIMIFFSEVLHILAYILPIFRFIHPVVPQKCFSWCQQKGCKFLTTTFIREKYVPRKAKCFFCSRGNLVDKSAGASRCWYFWYRGWFGALWCLKESLLRTLAIYNHSYDINFTE